MAVTARKRLQELFIEELEGLRGSAAEFQADFPTVASNLSLDQGKSRDPHVEHLVQAFAWMVARLRAGVETEKNKLPSLLLDHLHSDLCNHRPVMAMASARYDPSSNNSLSSYVLESGRILSPSELDYTDRSLSACRFLNPFDVRLVPLECGDWSYQEELPVNVTSSFRGAFSSLSVDLVSTEEASFASDYHFEDKVNFFVSGVPSTQASVIELLARNLLGILITDSAGTVLRRLDPTRLSFNEFANLRGLLGDAKQGKTPYSLLHDYFSFPERYMFFECAGFSGLKFPLIEGELSPRIKIQFILDQRLPPGAKAVGEFVKTNCFPIVNLFERTSEPIEFTGRKTRYQIIPSSHDPADYEVFKVSEVVQVDSDGAETVMAPSAFNRRLNQEELGDRWVALREESTRKNTLGTDTWLSVHQGIKSSSGSQKNVIYAKTLCSNRTVPEKLRSGQSLVITGVSPLNEIKLVSRPTKYGPAMMTENLQWELLSRLASRRIELLEPRRAKEELVRLLSLFARSDDAAANRQIRSIRSVSLEETSVPSSRGGWRGFARATEIKIEVDSNQFEGSLFLFGSVLQHFFAVYSYLNNYIVLTIYKDDQEYFQWKPISGCKALA